MLAAPTTRADVWTDALTSEAERALKAEYDAAIADGDRDTLLATSESASPARNRKRVLEAAAHYEHAHELMPDEPEAPWQAAKVLFSFFVDCDEVTDLCTPGPVRDKKLVRRIIGLWDRFEKNAPLDPRVAEIRFERALLHTKLATDDDLRAAIVDYEVLLDTGIQLATPGSMGNTLGNLAESYMMLGQLEPAITRYRDALEISSDESLYYGLAIAYDRDDQGAKAKEIILALGETSFATWQANINSHRTFYVPDGEVHYYFALIHEAFGHTKAAISHWKIYLESGAHPQFQPRAREHLDALKAKKAKDEKPSR